MIVYIVLDDSKAGYDAGGIYSGVFATKEEAEIYIGGYSKIDQGDFEILEEEI
jgi:hypothetical protein